MTKNDEIYDLVIDRLLRCEYGFGQRILVKELAADTGISRQPIMSALGRLASHGFVNIIPQVGCQVIRPDRNGIADFYLMFQRMEGLLAELAATRRSENQVKSLIALQRRIVQLDQNPHNDEVAREYSDLNREFHQLIHEMAVSPLIDQLQRSNFNMSDFFINQSVGFSLFMSDAVQEHEEIIAAIANGEPERARAVSEAHIAAVASAVLSGV